MKKNKIIYWITSALVALVMLASGLFFAVSDSATEAFAHLGFPDYFRIELSAAKITGGLLFIIPGVPHRLREFIYHGFAIVLVSAIIAHFSSGDGLVSLDPIFFLLNLVISYIYYHRLRNSKLELQAS